MTTRNLERRFRRAVVPAAVCAGALVLAAALPAPAGAAAGPGFGFGIDRQPAADTVPLPAGVIDVRDATDKPRLVNGAQMQRLLVSNYPPMLRDAGVTGRAEVAMVVTAGGAVVDARAVESTHPAFADAAVAVMRQARFEPARREGRPVAVRLRVPVSFTVSRDSAQVPGVPAVVPPAAPAAPSAAPAGQGSGVVDASALDRRPTLLNAAEVQRALAGGYPPLLRDAGIAGQVQVAFLITPEGATREARVVSTNHEAFGEPALAAVRAMRFTPGEQGGRVVTARVQIPVSFSVERTEPASPPQGT